jgi:hypothetical protein
VTDGIFAPFRCRVVAADELFVMNWHSEESLDGRYFGVIPASVVIGQALPLIEAAHRERSRSVLMHAIRWQNAPVFVEQFRQRVG